MNKVAQEFKSPNPLEKYYRQPKVYTTLPSKGKFYPPDTIEMPENGELPILPMTAKDELTMKTPDALLNGQATVNLIESCIPAIKNAWAMPSIDVDAVLIAIRIATYGESMDLDVKVPNTGDERKFTIDLRNLLNTLVTSEYVPEVDVNDMHVELQPLSYKEFTDASLKTFEEQRIFSIVNNNEIPEHKKMEQFNESFLKLTELTVSTLSKCIVRITVGDTTVTDPTFINDFIDNADKHFYNDVVEHLELQKEKFQIEPLKVESSDEDIEKGAPAEWTVPITFDQSNFFG